MQADIVSFGEAMVELNAIRQVSGTGFLAGFGGDTSNCAVAAARQGARAGYISAVGLDPFGRDLLQLWRGEGVDTAHVRIDPQAPTGIYFVTHGSNGHEFSYYRSGSAASRISIDQIPEDYIAQAKVLHLSGISQAISVQACDACFHAIDIARRSGVRVAYDPNLRLKLWPVARARAVIHAALALADIAFPSLEDARLLAGMDNAEDLIQFYLGLGPRVVVLKMGAAGALVGMEGHLQRVPGHKLETVDATGAGDVFDGAFLARLVDGDDPFAAARYANAAAALSTRGYGAIAPIPLREEVEAFLASSTWS